MPNFSSIRSQIESVFKEVLKENEVELEASFSDETILLETGLDSIGFAILVARLEEELKYDPFVLMTDAVYPRTFGEFVSLYEKYGPINQ